MITKFDSFILEYFKNKRLCGATTTKFLSIHKEIDSYLEDFLLTHPEYIKKSFVINCIVRYIDLSSMKCKICGKQQDYYHKESVYCSHKCMISDPDYQKKRMNSYKKNCLAKYGVDNTYAVKEFIEKKKQTCLERYGVEYSTQNEEVKKKIRETNLQKYGVKYFTQTEEYKRKTQETCLRKYGVNYFLSTLNKAEDYVNPFSKEEIKEKIKETNLERYGVEHFTQSTEYKNYMDVLKGSDKWKEITKKNKANGRKTSFEKYGKEHHNTVKSWNFIQTLSTVKPLFTFEEYEGSTKNYMWECLKCRNTF